MGKAVLDFTASMLFQLFLLLHDGLQPAGCYNSKRDSALRSLAGTAPTIDDYKGVARGAESRKPTTVYIPPTFNWASLATTSRVVDDRLLGTRRLRHWKWK